MGMRTLHRDLGKALISGAGEADPVSAMNEAILTAGRPDTEARRLVLAILDRARLMPTNRLAVDAFVLLKFRTCFRYCRLDGFLEAFITDLLRAVSDPGRRHYGGALMTCTDRPPSAHIRGMASKSATNLKSLVCICCSGGAADRNGAYTLCALCELEGRSPDLATAA